MLHESDKQTASSLIEIEKSNHLGLNGSIPELVKLRQQIFDDKEVPISALRWELIAFCLYLSEQLTCWDLYIGPSMSGTGEEGQRIDSPALESITQDCLDYWQKRMVDSSHPVMRARYADAVWEISQKATGQRRPIKAARIAIDSYLEATINQRFDPPDLNHAVIQRMISLSLHIKDHDRLKEISSSLESMIDDLDDPKTKEWYIRDIFTILTEIPKKHRPSDLLQKYAELLKSKLFEIPFGKGKQWAREELAFPLAKYYWITNNKDEAKNVLKFYGEAVIHESNESKAMLAVGWLQQLHKVFVKYEMNENAATVLLELQKHQSGVPNEMLRISSKHEITKEEIDKFLEEIIVENLEKSLQNTVFQFIPSIERVRDNLVETDQSFPLQAMISNSIIGDEGRTVASINPGSEDDGRLIQQLARTAQFDDIFLQFVFESLIEKFEMNSEIVMNELRKSPVWKKGRLLILERGVKAYFEGDSIVAIHLLIPEIESAIRSIAELKGIRIQKTHRHGGFILKNLDDLIRENEVIEVLGEDAATYFRALLTDQRGWNLRNDICHGISKADSQNIRVARRILFLIFFLGLLRVEYNPKQENPKANEL